MRSPFHIGRRKHNPETPAWPVPALAYGKRGGGQQTDAAFMLSERAEEGRLFLPPSEGACA